jgi:hypothetical protein
MSYCQIVGMNVPHCPKHNNDPCPRCDGSVFGRVYCVWAGEECTACPQHREKPCQFCDGTPWEGV